MKKRDAAAILEYHRRELERAEHRAELAMDAATRAREAANYYRKAYRQAKARYEKALKAK